MKIIEHTFKIPKLGIENGKLTVGKDEESTYTFTLLYKGLGIYEEMTGKPLINDIIKIGELKNDADKVMALLNGTMVKNLACASYVRIDGDRFHNNRATAEEFKKLPVYNYIDRDYDFIMQLYNMAMDCVSDNAKQVKNNKEVTRSKK